MMMQPAFTCANRDGALLVIACKAAHEYEGANDPALHHLQRMLVVLDDLCARHDVRKIQTLGPLYAVVAEEQDDAPPAVHVLYQYARDAFYNMHGWHEPGSMSPMQLQSALHVGRLASGILGLVCVRYSVYGTVLHVAQQLLNTCPHGALHMSHEAFVSLPNPPQNTVALVRIGMVEMHTHIVSQDVLVQQEEEDAAYGGWCGQEKKHVVEHDAYGQHWHYSSMDGEMGTDGMLLGNKDWFFFSLLFVVAAAQYAVGSMHAHGSTPLMLCLITSTILSAFLLITSTTQPLHTLHWRAPLVAMSILLTLACNSALVAWYTPLWMTVLQRVALLTVTHAVVLNMTPMCCADLMPPGVLYGCIVVPTVWSAAVAHGLLLTVSPGGGEGRWSTDGALVPHVLTSGVMPLMLALCMHGHHVQGGGGGYGAESPSSKSD